MKELDILDGRKNQVSTVGGTNSQAVEGNKRSLAGSVSQRACVFCGSRVVLYPIGDALHIIHGPIGCAAYTWDIRGSQSSGMELHRLSFSTDLHEKEVVTITILDYYEEDILSARGLSKGKFPGIIRPLVEWQTNKL